MIVFYAINSFVHFEFLNDAANPMGIAVIHSTFNIAKNTGTASVWKGIGKAGNTYHSGDRGRKSGGNPGCNKTSRYTFLREAGICCCPV